MAYHPVELQHSPWKLHRSPNLTVYSSPRNESPMFLAELQKSGRNPRLCKGYVDPFLLEESPDYRKQVSSPISDGELHPRKDGTRKTYKTPMEKSRCFAVPKDNRKKRTTDHRPPQIPSDRKGNRATKFDEYNFPLMEDEAFERGGKDGGRMTLKEFRESQKRARKPRSSSSASEEMMVQFRVPHKPKCKPAINSVDVLSDTLKNLYLEKLGRP